MIKVISSAVLLGSQLFLATLNANAANTFRHHQPSSSKILNVSGIRNWYLIGNALTPGNNIIQIKVAKDPRIKTIVAYIDKHSQGMLAQTAEGFNGSIDIASLTPGQHSLELMADGDSKRSFKKTFFRSQPYYVLLTTDWDSSDSQDAVLKLHDRLHREHSTLKITHFLGPYTFTDPSVSPKRKAYLANWVRHLRDTYQDEIGLHIHPFCNFVNTVPDLRCRFKPSDSYKKGDSSGYTVLSSAYSEPEFLRLLKAADALFSKQGLGKPTAFRTGSWAANAGILKALAADGFIVDSSANNWIRIKEESEHDGNGVLYRWNRQHWRAINDRSQPYFPAALNPMSGGLPSLPLLEVPDNGSLVDYVTSAEMISIFKANWQNLPLTKPKTYVFGFHPVSYDAVFDHRIQQTLYYIDRFLAKNDNGPVVYETLSHIAQVFPPSSPESQEDEGLVLNQASRTSEAIHPE